MWFETLTGFREESGEQVRRNLSVEGMTLRSRVNGKRSVCGTLETPSLGELRTGAREVGPRTGKRRIREIVDDVQRLHIDERNHGALFQVASQFNLLEMTSPDRTPEEGVGIYAYDPTQGPACAIAAGAGTIYRNYFAKVDGRVGQTQDDQIDCLRDLGVALGNADGHLWEMRNGYALASAQGLDAVSMHLASCSEAQRDALRTLLRIGIQQDTQVTLADSTNRVTQAYCSALPVAYSGHAPARWEAFARLVLEASYEATLCAALINAHGSGNARVYLTKIGGGAFGNPIEWIVEAMRRALDLYADKGLDIALVSYGHPDEAFRFLSERYR